jgi:hypothetical protein
MLLPVLVRTLCCFITIITLITLITFITFGSKGKREVTLAKLQTLERHSHWGQLNNVAKKFLLFISGG